MTRNLLTHLAIGAVAIILSSGIAEAVLINAGGNVITTSGTVTASPAGIGGASDGVLAGGVGGGDYYTDAPGGFPSDYIATAGAPVFVLDLGSDLSLDFAALFNRAGTGNGNEIREFSLRIATDAQVSSSDGAGHDFGAANVYDSGPLVALDISNVQQNFDFGGTFAGRYVEFTVSDNGFGIGAAVGGDRVGFDDIQFNDASGFDLTMKLNVDRTTGQVSLENNTGATVDVAGLGILSSTGALVPSNWKSVAGNYDQGGSVSADEWDVFVAANNELSEGTLGTGSFTQGQAVDLGTGTWLKNTNEDVTFEYLDANTGEEIVGQVFFVAGDGGFTDPFEVADLNFDGTVDDADWPIYRDGFREDLSGLSVAESYGQGDLNGDGANDPTDFGLFKAAYNAAQGPGAFEAMLASVPEPTTSLLLVFGGMFGLRLFRRKNGPLMSRNLLLVVGILGCLGLLLNSTNVAEAALLGHYEFDNPTDLGIDSAGGDNNGTALGSDVSAGGGRVGTGALVIDGTGIGLELANPETFQPLTTFTIASFVKPDFASANWGNAGTVGRVFGALGIDADGAAIPDTTNSGYGFGVINNGQIRYTTYGIQDYNQPAGVVTDEWQHIAVVVVGGDATFYLDGNNVGTIAGANPGPTTNPYHIGASAISNSDRWAGSIDELRIYDNALSDADIAELANVGQPRLTLKVNTTSGQTSLLNESGITLDIDLYEILSPGPMSALNPIGWQSLQDQDYEGSGPPNGTGDGWEELGTPRVSFLGEGFLQGSSSLADQTSISLGKAFDPSVFGQDVDGNLEFNFRTATGSLLAGEIEYETGGVVDPPGDYNASGLVEQGDLDLVLLNWGASWPPTIDGWVNGQPTDGTIDQNDLDGVLLNWGNSAASASAQAVPEPSSGLVLLLGALTASGLWSTRRRKQPRNDGERAMNGFDRMRIMVVTSIGICLLGGSTLMAGVTNDREYWFGEDSLEGPSQGATIGSNNSGGVPAGTTVDSIGPTGAFLDLTQSGGPTYQQVGPGAGGLARPGVTGSEFGVRFDGVDDRLSGVALNRPDEMAGPTPIGNGPLVPSYPFNYDTITVRGLQGWVYPDQAGIDKGVYQSIVFDTIFSGGPAINELGQWTQTNSFHPSAGVAQIPATVDVAGDTWYHVMHHNYADGDPSGPTLVPDTGAGRPFTSVLYVNGIAVSANNDNINPGGDAAYTGSLLLGVAENGGEPGSYVNYFQGVVDDLEMYVYGDNSSEGGQNWGTFDLFADNEWIATEIANTVPGGVLTAGDVNKDGFVNGDGNGPAESDDVTAFIEGWRSENAVAGAHNSQAVGDWLTWEQGDLNHDGRTSFADWYLLRANHPTPAGLDLMTLLNGVAVPEPSTAGLALFAIFGMGLGRRRR